MDTDFMSKWQQERTEAAAKGKAYLLGLVPALKAANVEKVIAHYDGEGDSGQFEDVRVVVTGSEDAVEVTKVPGLADDDKIRDAAYDILEEKHGGWEINEGSFGDVILYVETERLVIEHNYRVESSTYDETEV